MTTRQKQSVDIMMISTVNEILYPIQVALEASAAVCATATHLIRTITEVIVEVILQQVVEEEKSLKKFFHHKLNI